MIDHSGNNVRIYYTDGASLIIKSTEVDAVDYFRPNPCGGGAWVGCLNAPIMALDMGFSQPGDLQKSTYARGGDEEDGECAQVLTIVSTFNLPFWISISLFRVIEALLGQHIPPRPASVRWHKWCGAIQSVTMDSGLPFWVVTNFFLWWHPLLDHHSCARNQDLCCESLLANAFAKFM